MKKIMNGIFYTLLVMVIGLFVSSSTFAEAKKLKLTCKNKYTLKHGQTKQLTVKVAGEKIGNKAVKWSSNAPERVSVTKSGRIKAIGAGKAVITAKFRNQKVKVEITALDSLKYYLKERKKLKKWEKNGDYSHSIYISKCRGNVIKIDFNSPHCIATSFFRLLSDGDTMKFIESIEADGYSFSESGYTYAKASSSKYYKISEKRYNKIEKKYKVLSEMK